MDGDVVAGKLKVEVWTSNQQQEEIHLFLPDEGNTYVMGYNPALISPAAAINFLAARGFVVGLPSSSG